MKRDYEIPLLFRILADDEMQAALDQVVNWIENPEEDSGKVTKIDRNTLGRRKLAYEIDGQRDGLYVLVKAQVDPQHLPELELNLKLFNPLLRFLILRDEPPRMSASLRRKKQAEAMAEAEASQERVVAQDPREQSKGTGSDE
jgi:small subunit ribosomal protein S6